MTDERNEAVPTGVDRPDRVPPKRSPTPGTARHRPTIEDVAAEAGVSRGTVSRVLNGGHHVSPAALEAVQRAVRRTGYTANRNARSLVTRRAGSVAFILSEPQERLFEDPNISTLLRCCTQALAREDVPLMMMITGSRDERERARRFLDGGHADGALLVSAHGGDPMMDVLLREGVPVVACGKPLGHERDIAYAAADDRQGAQLMVRHMIDRGRRRIATITGPLDTPGGIERLAGYRDVLGQGADERLVAHGDYTQRGGEAAMERLLIENPALDAVFVASDVMAVGALAALRRAGKRVPDDVAVGGFDDSRVAADTDPPLTTIRQPFPRIAEEMVRLLLALIAGGGPAAVVLPTELIVRRSA